VGVALCALFDMLLCENKGSQKASVKLKRNQKRNQKYEFQMCFGSIAASF
jgi:hypothetical protein